jgi:hypothetical protein
VLAEAGTIDEKTYVPLLWFAAAISIMFSAGMVFKGQIDARKFDKMQSDNERKVMEANMKAIEKELSEQKMFVGKELAEHKVLLTALKAASDMASAHHQSFCQFVGRCGGPTPVDFEHPLMPKIKPKEYQ